MEFKDWRHPTAEEIDACLKEIQHTDAIVLGKILVNNRIDFAMVHNPMEGDFDGDIEIAIGNGKDISFFFSRTGGLRSIVNNRPKPKPSPLAGACALKVA